MKHRDLYKFCIVFFIMMLCVSGTYTLSQAATTAKEKKVTKVTKVKKVKKVEKDKKVKKEKKTAPNTISPKSVPYKKKYMKKTEYNKQTKHYFLLKSYLEKLGSKGGGTLTLQKGTYRIPCTLYIPSNVTIKLEEGVRIVKTRQTETRLLTPTETLFETVSAGKAKTKRTVADYRASKNVKITATGKAVIDLGSASRRSGIYIGHASGVTIEGVSFKNRNAGSYIWIEGSSDVVISKCSFYAGKSASGKKSRMAVRMENIFSDTDTFEGKWSKLDGTKNQGITVDGCTFYKQDIAIGTTDSQTEDTKTLSCQNGIAITNNIFSDTTSYAVYAQGWNQPEISGNVMKTAATAKVKSFICGYGVANPTIKGNTFDGCEYTMQFGKTWAGGAGAALLPFNSDLGSASLDVMADNTVKNCDHYFVLNGKARILYFRDKTEKNFTVNTNTLPYREHYTNTSKYETRKLYYMFKSYMEQLEYAGGGTLTVEAGTYELPGNICVPSNVTINLKSGVVLKKISASASDSLYSKGIFTIVPPSKEGVKSSIKGYGGSQNVKISGTGTVIVNCNNILNAIGIVMGHAKNITIQGITFQNEYGSHFIELNSSYNVVVENCTFQNFKVYEEKSYKECINIDGTDVNTKGFNCKWSAHDKTMCQKVYIRKNTFKNVGTAVGTHTYSASGEKLLYHDNVQILNNTVDKTYNSAIRALNWKNCIVKGNTFTHIQSLSDGRKNESGSTVLYPAVSLKGVLNPTVTQNTISDVKFFPIVIDLITTPSTSSCVAAGYPNTVCSITDKNYSDMQNNTFKNIDSYYRFLLTRDTDSQAAADAEQRAIEVK